MDPSPAPAPAPRGSAPTPRPLGATTSPRPRPRPRFAPHGFLPLETRSKIAIATLAATLVLALACVWAVLAMRGFLTSLPPEGYDTRDSTAAARARDVDDRVDTLAGVALGARVLCAIAFLMWFYRAHENLRRGGLRLERTSGWAVGGFFIPIAGLVLPCIAMLDVWKGSHALADGGAATEWKRRPTSAIVLLWWFAFIGASILAGIARSLFVSRSGFGPQETAPVAGLISATNWMLASRFVEVLAAAAAIVLVVRISAAQARARESLAAVFD